MPIYVGNVIATGSFNAGLIYDTTGSMGSVEEFDSGVRLVFKEKLEDGTVDAVTMGDYRDFPSRTDVPEDYPYRISVPLTSDPDQIDNFVLTLGFGGDTPETIWSAIVDGLIGEGNLSNGAAIIIGDAPPLNPEPITGYTTASVISVCNSNNVKVYGISFVNGLFSPAWNTLVSETGGQTIVTSYPETAGDVASYLNTLFEIIVEDF